MLRIGLDIAAIVIGVGLACLGLWALRRRTASAVSEPQLESLSAIATAFGGSDDMETIARELLERVEPIVDVELSLLYLVDDERRLASGLLGRDDGRELAWFGEITVDLDNESSGVSTAVFEAAPFAVYDVRSSKIVSPRLAQATGARSAAFVPLLANERVIGVLIVGTTSELRAFSSEELTLLRTVAGEAALALDRTRSTAALKDALERERFVARISSRVRSELDVDELLRVAVEETGAALSVDRCFIRLGDTEDSIPIAAQWHAPGLSPIETGRRLAASNLAVRRRETVAIEDVQHAPELAGVGGTDALLELGSRALLAVPIVVFEELIGVVALHRFEPGPWTPGDVSLTEAVAREVGLGIHVARLLRDPEVTRKLRASNGAEAIYAVLAMPSASAA